MSPASTRRSCVAVLLLAGLVGSACTQSDESASTTSVSQEDITTSTTLDTSEPSPTSTAQEFEGSTTSWDPSVVTDTEAVDLGSVAPMMLIQFGQAWADADWKAMAAVADDEVVGTATELHVIGAAPPITGENVDAVIESCEAQAGGMWACQLDYGEEGVAATFTMTMAQTSNGLRIVKLARDGA